MVLGDAIEDADGHSHDMLGLLPVSTSFKNRKLSLGYRRLDCANGPLKGSYFGHEFQYTSIKDQTLETPLFVAKDATGQELGPLGHVRDNVFGSYAHLITPASKL